MLDRITPINKALIFANVALYVLQVLLGDVMDAWFALWPPQAAQYGYKFHVWQLLTYGFMHGGLTHLFFNMFALVMVTGFMIVYAAVVLAVLS